MKKVAGHGGAVCRRIARPPFVRSSGAESARVASFCEVDGEKRMRRRDHRRERRGEGARRGVERACYGECMAMACLEELSDDAVLEGVEMLARRSNEITA